MISAVVPIVLLCTISKPSIAAVVDDEAEAATALHDGGHSKARMFAFIRVAPEPCIGMAGITGTCFPSKYCTDRGGLTIGSCARGFGTCCQLDIRCPDGSNSVIVRDNNTNLLSPMGTTGSTNCRFDIEKLPGVCQLRLDLEAFQLDRPDATGECIPASMTITDSATVNNFKLCGQQTATSLYVAYGESANRISINFRLGVGNTYRVKVAMIRCIHQRVPNHCLQYFEADTMTVKSFGWPDYMINNQRYGVCIYRPTGSTQITWTTCDERLREERFLLSRYFSNDLNPPTAFLGALGDPSCLATSYVDVIGRQKHCGNWFFEPETVISNTGPFMLDVSFKQETLASIPPTIAYIFPQIGAVNTSYPCASGGTPTLFAYMGCQVTALGTTGQSSCMCTKSTTAIDPPGVIMRKGFCLTYVIR